MKEGAEEQMIEIVFNESAAGSLKIAQSYGKGKYRGGAISVFIKKKDGGEPTVEEKEAALQEAKEKTGLHGNVRFRLVEIPEMYFVWDWN